MDRSTAVAALAVALAAPLVGYAVAAALPGFAGFVVGSPSMEPAIESGSLVYVEETGDYERGDVVTFRRGDRTVTHRIVGETPEGYVAAGDANDAPDDWRVAERRVIGEVVPALPAYGTVVRLAGTPPGFAVGVALPAAVLLAAELRDLAGRLRAE
jgi:signal peptidase